MARQPRNLSEENTQHRPQLERVEARYEPGADAPVARQATSELLPARALCTIAVGEGTPEEPIRTTIERGETIPEKYLVGLTEGKHYVRGDSSSLLHSPKPVTFAGKAAKTAKILIMGHDPDDKSTRREWLPGEIVPMDQLVGLREGVHYE